MTATNDSSEKLPLDAFTRSTPPGWRAGVKKYPYKRYLQLMRLWWRQTDVEEPKAGIVIAGRLRGAAFQFALGLSANRYIPPDADTGWPGGFRDLTGDELLCQPSYEAFTDPASGVDVPAGKSGAGVLLDALGAEYGVSAQEGVLAALDTFFDCTRGQNTMETYISMYEMAFSEART